MRALASAQPATRHSTWVDAAPFRAHVRHAVEAAAVPWPAVAVATGVSLPAVHALLVGRAGRPQTRIEPRLAGRLLRIGADELIAMRSLRVPAARTGARLRNLLAAGVDPLWVARWCQIGLNELTLLVEGEATSCTQLTETLGLAAQRLRQTDACWPPLAA